MQDLPWRRLSPLFNLLQPARLPTSGVERCPSRLPSRATTEAQNATLLLVLRPVPSGPEKSGFGGFT